MKANWFLGFPLAATPWLAVLEPPPAGSRLFHPDDVHVTFAFLGPVTEARAFAAWEAASRLALAPTAFPAGPLRAFGNPRRPSAWSVEPADGVPVLGAFIAAHRTAVLEVGGGPADLRPPRPHATLARPSRNAEPHEHLALREWAQRQRLPALALPITRLALFTWSPTRRDRLFSVIAERSLAA